MRSAAGRPAVGRALARHHAWGVVLCLSLVSGLLFLPATVANAMSFVVSDIGDEGQGSLRQAILDANANPGADDITFAIDASGPQTISPQSPLPAITGQVSIDATTQPGASCDSWPPTLLVRLEGSSPVLNTPGLTVPSLTVAGGAGTVIKGFIIRRFSGDGVSLLSPASGTTVTCNAIGTTPDGTAQVGVTGAGVAVRSTDPAATAPTTISGNIIMNNGGPAVLVDPDARLVSIRGNRMNDNLGVGIDLVTAGGPANGDGPTPNATSGPGSGGNDLRYKPDLLSAVSSGSATKVTGSLTVPSAGAGEFDVEFFSVANCDTEPSPGGFGEGARPIGSSVLPASSGPAAVPFVVSGLSNVNVGNFVTATATDGFGSGNTSEFSACTEVVADTGTSSADLSVSGSASPDPASGTGTIAYAFIVHDEGPDPAADATLVSELPPGLDLDSMSPSCIATIFTVTCDLGTINPGPDPANDVHVTIVVVAQEIGADMLFDNHVSVRSSTPDPDDSNNELTVSSTVLARRSDLSIHKAGPAEVTSGDAFSYTIDISNAGPGPADGVTVTDPLPTGASFVAATPNICTEDLGAVSCALGTLASGASTSIELQVVADGMTGDDPVVVSNTASVGSDRLDLDPANDVSEAVATTVLPAGNVDATDLELTSVLNVPNPVTGGYDLGSTATVTNLGPGDATGVTLTDTLAPGESFVAGGSDPSCTANAGVVTCALGDMASGDFATVLIITKTPRVAVDTTIHDAFAVAAPEDSTPDNDALDVATAVRARRADFVAGYVPASPSITWLNDATQWRHGDPVATIADPTVAFVGIPGGGPGGPVTITERPCGAPFACMTLRRANGSFHPARHGVFGNLIQVSVPSGYGASNPITGIFLDDWSVLGSGWDPFKVSYQNGSTGTPNVLSSCGGWKHTGPPCVSSIGRSFSWWNPSAFADLYTVVRFTNGGTFGRGR